MSWPQKGGKKTKLPVTVGTDGPRAAGRMETEGGEEEYTRVLKVKTLKRFENEMPRLRMNVSVSCVPVYV